MHSFVALQELQSVSGCIPTRQVRERQDTVLWLSEELEKDLTFFKVMPSLHRDFTAVKLAFVFIATLL